MTDDQKHFLQLVAGPALDSERRLKIPAAVTVAQAILESSAKINGVWTWGGSRLFREAHNPFGIKNLDLPDDYGEYVAETTEFVGARRAVPVQEIAEFERFASLDHAFFHHALLFWRSKRYWPAVQAWLHSPFNDPRAFAMLIGPCGYATDPNYGEKLCKLIDEFKLDDRAVLNCFAGAGAIAHALVEGIDV